MPLPDSFQVEKGSRGAKVKIKKNFYRVKILDVTATERAAYKSTEIIPALQFTLEVQDAPYTGLKVWTNKMRTKLWAGARGSNPSTLYKLFKAAVNSNLTQEEAQNVTVKDINDLIGKEFRALIEGVEIEGAFYNNVLDFDSLDEIPAGVTTPEEAAAVITDEVSPDDIPF